VKNYLRNTFDKLGVWSRLELAMRAVDVLSGTIAS
jgi:DNA-binding NarL/FixJ family response regulator